MQALENIVAANTRATKDAIPAEQRKGHFVVAKYTGVNFMGYTLHPNYEEAEEATVEHSKTPGFRAVIHPPIARPIHQSPLPANATP